MNYSPSIRRQLVHIAGPLAVLSCAATVSFVAGCNLVTPASYVLFGPGKTEAEHALDPVRTIVFVDDRANVLPRTVLRVTIGEKISQDLLGEGAIPNAVDPKQAIAITRQKESGAKAMSIAAIGRELDCQQVIYVQITSWSLSGDGTFSSTGGGTGSGMTPTVKATVKVIDVVNNERRYPEADVSGRDIMATVREVDPNALTSVAKRRAVEEKLALELGDNVAKLFYQHERLDLGENLGPRNK